MTCVYCNLPAVTTKAVTDMTISKSGEIAYKLIPLCHVHAMDARMYGHRLWRLDGTEIASGERLPDQVYEGEQAYAQ